MKPVAPLANRLTLPLVSTGSALGAALLASVAMALYPSDVNGRGYSFFRHYWCDLFDPLTPAGLINHGSWWAVAAEVLLGVGLIPVFWSFRSVGRGLLTAAGLLGCFGVVFVPVVTAMAWLDVHGWLILVTGPPGLAALVFAVLEQRRRGERAAVRAGGALMMLGGWNFLQYARQLVLGAPRWAGLPAVQKAATVALLIWLIVSVWSSSRLARQTGGAPGAEG